MRGTFRASTSAQSAQSRSNARLRLMQRRGAWVTNPERPQSRHCPSRAASAAPVSASAFVVAIGVSGAVLGAQGAVEVLPHQQDDPPLPMDVNPRPLNLSLALRARSSHAPVPSGVLVSACCRWHSTRSGSQWLRRRWCCRWQLVCGHILEPHPYDHTRTHTYSTETQRHKTKERDSSSISSC